MLTVSRESFKDCIEEAKPLFVDHWEEVAHHRDRVPLDPDYERYIALEKTGNLVVIVARKDGVLIGYSCFFLYKHIHYKTHLVASNDVIFLSKNSRAGSGLGIRLIKESERILKDVGVDRIVWHIKPDHDWSLIMDRLGYKLEEKIMGKLLLKGE